MLSKEVSFELAKLLKEKRFDRPTESMYASNGILTDSVYDFDDWCFAPTIDEVKWWLYEKHDIWIVVNIAIDDMWYFELYNLKDKRNAQIIINDENITDFYKSPTEAYEFSIKYILTKLI